ncbi:MAG: TRAP transporter small permease [Pseudomonadota bacterium]
MSGAAPGRPAVAAAPGRPLCRALDLLGAACLVVMVVLVFGNVVLRYAFNAGITISEELARWLFVWLTFLGAVAALVEHGHLGTDLLVSRLGRRARRVVLVIAQLAMLGATALLLQGAWLQMLINWDVQAPVSGLSMGIFYASGVAFGIGAGAVLLGQLWRSLTGRLSDQDLVMVQESEELAQLARLQPGPDRSAPR